MTENPDYDRIWLEDRNEASEANGRQWCCDKVWPEEDGGPEPTEYVRSDIADTLRADRDALREENERLRKVAHDLTNAITKVRPLGGSELFKRFDDQTYFADPAYCGAAIEELKSDLHAERKRAVREARA